MFEIYAYGNVDSLTGVFNAIAAIMGGADYFGLIKTIAVTGVLVAAFAGLFTPGRFHGWGWLMGFLMLYYALFLPKTDVVIIDKLGSNPPAVVGNVPLGVAFFGHATSKVGDVMTRFFETAFQIIPAPSAQIPPELTYQKNGVLFGNRLIQASLAASIDDPQLRTDLISYVHNCTFYDLQDGTIGPGAFVQSTDIWALMGNPNPARFSTYGNPVQIDTCPAVYNYLTARIPAEVAKAKAILAFQLNPSLEPTTAQGVIDSQIEQAYLKTRIATAAQGAADLLRQNILINLVQDAGALAGQKINDPAAVMLATARANATASLNSSFLTMGKVAEQALPLVRNVIEAVIYAVFPFVLLLLLLAQGRGLGLGIKSFVLSLVWIQLWPPLYAILNYVATLASARTLEAAARMGTNVQGLALETASSIYNGAISDQAIAGYMVISIPIIATAIIKGGEVAFQAITSVGPMQSAISGETSSTAKGNVTQDSVSMDQQQLAPTRTSAFMSSSSDAHGTTIQGMGVDKDVFRYQANMSRLATTFTFTERQAANLTESAREAEATAHTEREALQRSQSTALTHAMALQESFERSQQRSGTTATSNSGGSSSQLQTLNGIASEVNRKLGLNQDSIVGKTIVASASAGAKIPFTEIGAQTAIEGRKLEQERLQSAYDQARRVIESTNLADATTLSKDFSQSDTYQWARSSRTAGLSSFESAHRESLDRQTTTEDAHTRARELARVAQFMREWSSGAQTDFTNYAARRLAERGLLREEDPVKLQRAVSEIAYGYARGGEVTNRFIHSDVPLPPTLLPKQLLGWATDNIARNTRVPADTINTQAVQGAVATNQKAVRVAQTKRGVAPGQHVGNDLATANQTTAAQAAGAIDSARRDVTKDQRTQSDRYNSKVNVNEISRNHGGNRAVWDTVSAQTENRAEVGLDSNQTTRPKRATGKSQSRQQLSTPKDR